MSDDYLWDRSGEPGDVAHLEEVLGRLAWSKRELRNVPLERKAWGRGALWKWAAAAAALVTAGTFVAVRQTRSGGELTSWRLSFSSADAKPMRTGQVIETSARRGTMESGFVGRVEIEPDSRLRLLVAREGEQRLALDRGTIHALIWAPPAQFVVETPTARAIDLGCRYTLQVGHTGVGLLTVETGWVAFQWHGIESFIPAGAACRTRPGHGPDTPYFLDASPDFKTAIAEFDVHGRKQALGTALAAARPRDGLTLWHLLQRTSGAERGEVFDCLAKLEKLPVNVSREAILLGDRRALDETWDSLKLGSSSWWREWKRQW